MRAVLTFFAIAASGCALQTVATPDGASTRLYVLGVGAEGGSASQSQVSQSSVRETTYLGLWWSGRGAGVGYQSETQVELGADCQAVIWLVPGQDVDKIEPLLAQIAGACLIEKGRY